MREIGVSYFPKACYNVFIWNVTGEEIPMRRLLIFACAFAAAALLFVYLLPEQVAYGLAIVFALCAFCLALLRRRTLRRLAIVSLGLAVGLIWCSVYQLVFYQPAVDAAGQTVQITAAIQDYPKQTSYGCSMTARVELEGRQIQTLLYLPEDAMGLQPGDKVTARAKLRLSSEGYTDVVDSIYYNAEGVFLVASASSYEQLPDSGPTWRNQPTMWNRALQERIAQIVPADASGLITALLTGERSGLSMQQKNDMKRAGIYHTVAVSGMHVSILLGIVLFLTRRKRMLSALIGIPVVILFILFIGGTPSVVRAGILYVLFLIAPVLRRESDSSTSLAAALLFLLLLNPWAVANIGLQLSFTSVAGILLFGSRLYRWAQTLRPEKEDPNLLDSCFRFVAASFSTTLGALVFTVPLSALYFGTISLIAPLANLLTLFAVTICFTLGIAATVCSFLLPPLGALLGLIVAWPVRYIFWMTALMARIPFAAIYTQSIYIVWWLVFVYGMLLSILLLGGVRRPLLPFCSGALTLGVCMLLGILPFGWASFTFSALDVGQGQCLVVDSKGATAVIDCGGSSASGAADTAAGFLQTMGYTTLDFLALTHYDYDHAGGVAQLLHTVPTRTVLLPPGGEDEELYTEIVEAAEQTGAEVELLADDLQLTFGTGRLQVFEPVGTASDNEASVSFLFSFGDYDALVTGDMGTSSEARLVRLHDLKNVELLVAGHHGSANSTGETLLEALQPETVLISVGKNSYGHPTEEVLDRITEAGAQIYRTDQCGTITIKG